jgi:hypothetical protein
MNQYKYVLNLVCRLIDVVNNTNNFISLGSIDISQQPVVDNISLNSPCELEFLVLINEVGELSLRLANSTLGTSEGVVVLALLLSLGLVSLNGERKNINSVLKSIDRVLLITFSERTWNLAIVEAVSIGEDISIRANLYTHQYIF